jgi:hypothetical protein
MLGCCATLSVLVDILIMLGHRYYCHGMNLLYIEEVRNLAFR